MSKYMNPQDAISAKMATCFITIDDNRYEFIQMKNFEAKFNMSLGEVPILGKTMKGHKPSGGDGEWSATAYFNQSIFRKLMLEYKNTGVFPSFEIQVTNEDGATSVGRQTVVLKECLIEGGLLASFDADSEFIEEDLSGTFDDFELPETFSLISGMQ